MAYPFAAAEVLTAVDLNAMIGAPTQNAQTGTTYTAVLLDAGKTVTLSNASAVTLTIPAQASVSWADNTQLNFLNLGAGTVTITPAAGVTINGTPLTLATSKGGSLVRTASNVWTFIPFSGGVEAANFTDTATGTYTDSGIDYKYLTLTGTGSVDIDQAGFADILVIAGGGGGAANLSGGGGAGGYLSLTSVYLTVGSHTAVVGGGGASGANGNASTLFNYYALPGGSAGSNTGTIPPNDFLTLVCGSGGGGGAISVANAAGGAGLSGQGFAGGLGNVNNTGTGGGGGASAVGADFPAATAGGAGGAGTSSSITGSAVTRAGGGGGSGQAGGGGAGGAGGGGAGSTTSGNAVSGTANTGSGGGGTHTGTVGLGGSGVVIIRVVV